MYKIVLEKDIDINAWGNLVEQSPVATWFQTNEAYDFFKSLSFLDEFVVAVENDGVLKGLVVGFVQKDGGKIKQYFSRRAIINGGPLLADDITEKELSLLLAAIKDLLKRKTIYIEFRNYNDYSRWRDVFEQNGFMYEPHYDVIVDTSSIETLNGRLDRNRRRNIKKAVENGIVIDKNPSNSDICAFYHMLEELYKTKVKTPLYPYEFFIKMKKIPSSLFCLAKEPGGNIIGGLVCVIFEGKTVYAWYACGEDGQYKKLSPSVMANYAGICHAVENGFSRFDFMGAGKPDDGGYGVRDFKLKFGGELFEYGRFKHISSKFLYSIGVLGVKLLKK